MQKIKMQKQDLEMRGVHGERLRETTIYVINFPHGLAHSASKNVHILNHLVT